MKMSFLQKGKVNVILDGQVGSCGKGKIGGFLALNDKPDFAACVYSPNAGHTFVDDNGKEVVVKQIPQSVVNPSTKLIIGPDAAINLDILYKEIEKFKLSPERLFISDRAIIIEESDVAWEKTNLARIASTFQGVGAAKARKVRRDLMVKLTGDVYALKPFITDTTKLVHEQLSRGATFIVEGHQGAGLDLNHGIAYPYCTSSMTNTSYFLAALGVPPRDVGEVIGVIRPYPIRVGDFQGHTSGPINLDSHEVSWDDVMRDCGGPPGYHEMTTVTKRVRRVFSWSDALYKRFVATSGPTQIAVNFIQYVSWIDKDIKGDYNKLSEKSRNFIKMIEELGNVNVTLIGTGPKNSEIVIK